MPEDRATLRAVEDLTWQPCPSPTAGCAALPAPWAARTGWGFGGRLDAIAARGQTYLTVVRQPEPGIWETLVLGGADAATPVARWRQRLPEAGCVLGAVSLTLDDGEVTAALPILRGDDETAPVVVLGAPEDLSAQRAAAPPRRRLATFGGPDAAVLARDVALARGDLLVVWEHEGRFALRAGAGTTHRPTPTGQAFHALLDATPVAGAVLYSAWTGERGSVWAASARGESRAVLRSDERSYDRFTTDGDQAAWTRARGRRDLNTFDEIELWTARVSARGLRGARRVTALPAGPLPLVALGEGWAAVWHGGRAVRLVRLADGATRWLPALEGLTWDGGPGGIALAGGAVWARAARVGAAGNDHRLLVRLDLDALPQEPTP
ncbi:MAG: hypothetical protein R3B48_06465 [Kofleriaceae bacterium]